jgi:hypothetical protein
VSSSTFLRAFFSHLRALRTRITFKASKPISFIVDYVLRRRYGQHVSPDNQRTASVTFAAGEKLWTRQDRNLPMREVFAVLSQPYRLTYCFDERILEGAGGEAAVAGAASNAEAFEAKTRNATTLFDASNSLFNNVGGAGLGDISLGFGFFGESSLLGGGSLAPVVAPAMPVPTGSNAGPLASQFEIENSFGSFLTSPLVTSVVNASSARSEPTEAKRSLFD